MISIERATIPIDALRGRRERIDHEVIGVFQILMDRHLGARGLLLLQRERAEAGAQAAMLHRVLGRFSDLRRQAMDRYHPQVIKRQATI